MQPMLGCSQRDLLFSRTTLFKLLLHLRCFDKINNILGLNVSVLGNTLEVKLDCLCKVLVVQDRQLCLAKPMNGKHTTAQELMDPGLDVACMIAPLPLCFGHNQGGFMPGI
jgi:hypothetical protein